MKQIDYQKYISTIEPSELQGALRNLTELADFIDAYPFLTCAERDRLAKRLNLKAADMKILQTQNPHE